MTMATSLSLLDGLKRNDHEAWEQFRKIYQERLHKQLWLILRDQHDVEDVYQEVLVVLRDRMPTFDRQRTGSFRTFLKLTCLNIARDRRRKNRKERPPSGVPSPDDVLDVEQLNDSESELSKKWEQDHEDFVAGKVLEELRKRCGDRNYEIWCEFVQKKLPRAESAEKFGMSIANLHVVYHNVQKVLNQIKAEWGDLFE